MMNRDVIADHNICGSSSACAKSHASASLSASRRSEAGYTLVALLALMTVVALFAMAVAPRVQQQAQRDREQEAIFRGEQVADAIRDYYRYRSSIVGAAEIKRCLLRWNSCSTAYRFQVDSRTARSFVRLLRAIR
jgi:type II secretory pathway pseudopilin PulG